MYFEEFHNAFAIWCAFVNPFAKFEEINQSQIYWETLANTRAKTATIICFGRNPQDLQTPSQSLRKRTLDPHMKLVLNLRGKKVHYFTLPRIPFENQPSEAKRNILRVVQKQFSKQDKKGAFDNSARLG